MNWGHKIAIFYSIFAIAMVTMVIWSTKYDVNLVSDNYYSLELDHDDRVMAIKNSRSLELPLTIQYRPANENITLTFPESTPDIQGTVLLYYIADRKQDKLLTLPAGSQEFIIPTEDLRAGRWKVKVDWNSQGERYFDEKGILVLNQRK